MSLTLENIRFYRPPSLPARPAKTIRTPNPPNPQNPSIHPISHRAYPVRPYYIHNRASVSRSSPSKSLPTSYPQTVLQCPLPPRPPVKIPRSPSLGATSSTLPLSTCTTVDPQSIYPNDFDREIQDVVDGLPGIDIKYEDDENEKSASSQVPPPAQEGGSVESVSQGVDDGCGLPVTVPDMERQSTVAACPTSSEPSAEAAAESIANADPTQPHSRDAMEIPDRGGDIAAAERIWLSPESAASKGPRPMPTLVDMDLSPDRSTTASPAQGPSTMDPEETYGNHSTYTVPDSRDPASTVEGDPHNGRTGQPDTSGNSVLAAMPTEGVTGIKNTQDNQSTQVPSPVSIAVVIPASSRSHTRSLKRPATPPSRNHEAVADRSALTDPSDPAMLTSEDDADSDSVPSDDENDADYIDNTETAEAEEQLPSSKRRRVNDPPDQASLPARRSTRLSSESSHIVRPDPAQRASDGDSLESEAIPVQGFLRLRHRGSEVIYCLEFSQTHFSSIFVTGQREASQPAQRTRNSTIKARFSPEEDALIVELKEQNLGWDDIEDRFAERFPYRPKSSLQVRYSKRLKPSR